MPSAVTTAPGGQSTEMAADAPAVVNPFVRAAREHREQFHDQTHDVGASSINVGPIDVAPFGFARSILLRLEMAGGAAGLATVAAADDAPWNAIDNVMISDVNGRPIVGPFSGYDLYLAHKFGAYRFDSNPVNLPGYSAVDSDGDFTIWLRIPLEITSRDGLGSLPNMTAASTYKLSYTVSGSGTIYTTAPDTLGDLQVEAWLEAWTQPPAVDPRGVANQQTPPAMGTTQFWSKTQFNITAGEQRIRLTRMGNLVRNLVAVFRNDASPSVRNTSEIPADFRLEWDGRILDNIARDVLRNQTREHFGYDPDTGVLVWDFTHDADGHAGNEARHLYLPTTQATRLELVGTFGGDGVLTVLTNDVAPVLGAA